MKLILFLLCLCFFISCEYENEEDLLGNNQPSCVTSNLIFSNDIEPIVARSCSISGCHVPGGTGNGNFTNSQEFFAKVDNGALMNRAVIERSMPPDARIPDCDVEKIKEWINQGANKN